MLKFDVSLPKHHGMKTHKTVEVKFHSLLTSVLDGNGW